VALHVILVPRTIASKSTLLELGCVHTGKVVRMSFRVGDGVSFRRWLGSSGDSEAEDGEGEGEDGGELHFDAGWGVSMM
jgi:hypothetical protein